MSDSPSGAASSLRKGLGPPFLIKWATKSPKVQATGNGRAKRVDTRGSVCLRVFVFHPGITPLGNDPEWFKITRLCPEMCLNGVSTLYSQGVIQKPLECGIVLLVILTLPKPPNSEAVWEIPTGVNVVLCFGSLVFCCFLHVFWLNQLGMAQD